MPPEGTALSPELRGLGTTTGYQPAGCPRQTADTTGSPLGDDSGGPPHRPDGQYGGSQPDHRSGPDDLLAWADSPVIHDCTATGGTHHRSD